MALLTMGVKSIAIKSNINTVEIGVPKKIARLPLDINKDLLRLVSSIGERINANMKGVVGYSNLLNT